MKIDVKIKDVLGQELNLGDKVACISGYLDKKYVDRLTKSEINSYDELVKLPYALGTKGKLVFYQGGLTVETPFSDEKALYQHLPLSDMAVPKLDPKTGSQAYHFISNYGELYEYQDRFFIVKDQFAV